MKGQVGVIIGATGLVGGHLFRLLVNDLNFEKIIVISRRPFNGQHEKVENRVVNFENNSDLAASFDNADVIFCTIGTTQKKVKGDKGAYRKVDFDIPVNMAKMGLQKGVKQFILVSAVGADAHAGNFYLRLKGEVEETVSSLGYESLYILRPSILLGKRDEFRLGESIGKAVLRSASFLFFGNMRKYYPVKAKQLAQAMINASKEKSPGSHVLFYDEMVKLAGRVVN